MSEVVEQGGCQCAPTDDSGNASRLPPPASRPFLRLISFGIVWFFLALSVESSLVPIVDVIFEHRLYLPGFGAALIFSAVLGLVLVRREKALSKGVWLAGAVLIVFTLMLATFERNKVWQDDVRLWLDVVEKSPNKARPYNNLGAALNADGRPGEAAGYLLRAIEIDPLYYHAYNNLGHAYILLGQSAAALPILKKAMQMAPTYSDPYVNYAAALNQLRRFSETVVFLEKNRQFLAERVEFYYHLGVAYAFLGQLDDARRQLAVVSQFEAPELVEDLLRLVK